jgi:hypothetical protein
LTVRWAHRPAHRCFWRDRLFTIGYLRFVIETLLVSGAARCSVIQSFEITNNQ